MHIEILDDAKEDILSGALFYEVQQYGAGDYFLDSISSDIESLHLYAGIHPLQFGYYKLLSKRFPYTIYYDLVEDRIRVIAVLDDRQNPTRIENRLKGSE
jgi:plasmid stabilization system protein ParE